MTSSDPNQHAKIVGEAIVNVTLNNAFLYCTLNPNEIKHHAIEKEAAAILKALWKWCHFLLCRHSRVITDQKSISFMFNNTRKSKIKAIRYAIGSMSCPSLNSVLFIIQKLRILLLILSCISAHPHVARPLWFVSSIMSPWHYMPRSRNLPFSFDQIKSVIKSPCTYCQYLKTKFITSVRRTLKNNTTIPTIKYWF